MKFIAAYKFIDDTMMTVDMSMTMRESVKSNKSFDEIVVATLNVNGLPAFRQSEHTKSLLAPYELRHKAICTWLESSDIQIINMQEVFTHRDRRLFETYLRSFPYASYASSFAGPKGALVTFSRLPLETVSYESYFLAGRSADRSHLPPLSLTKCALKGILVSKLTDQPLTIVNTHPVANDDWNWSIQNRFYSLQKSQLTKLAKAISGISGDVILGADLNTAKDSELFAGFLRESNLHDSFANDARPTFYQEFLQDGQTTRCIDFLLARGGLVVTNQQRILEGQISQNNGAPMYLSDHVGLAASIHSNSMLR